MRMFWRGMRHALCVAALALTVGGSAWAASIGDVTTSTTLSVGDLIATDGPAGDVGLAIKSDGSGAYEGGTVVISGSTAEVDNITISSDAAMVAGIAANPAASAITVNGTISVTGTGSAQGVGGILYAADNGAGGFTGTITAKDILVDASATTASIATGAAFAGYTAGTPTAAANIDGDVTAENITVTGGTDAASEAHGIWGGELATSKTLTAGNITATAGGYAAGINLNGGVVGDLTALNITATSTDGSARGVTVGGISGSVEVGDITVTAGAAGAGGNAKGLVANAASTGNIIVGAITASALGTGTATGLDLIGGHGTGTLTLNGAITANTTSGLALGIYAGGLNGAIINQNITATSETGTAKGIFTDSAASDFTIGANVAIKGNGDASSYDIDLGNGSDKLTFDSSLAGEDYSQSIIVNGAETVDLGNGVDVQKTEFLAGTKFTGTTNVNVLAAGDVTVHEGDVFDTAAVAVADGGQLTFDVAGREVMTSVVTGTGTAVVNKTDAGELVAAAGITLGTGGELNLNEGQLTVSTTATTITGGAMNIADNTVLAFDGTAAIAAGSSGAVDFANNGILAVAAGSTAGGPTSVITDLTVANATLAGDAFADQAALETYLDKSDVAGLLFDVDFGYNGTDVTLTTAAQTQADAAANVAGVLSTKYGVGDMASYTNNVAAGWFDIVTDYNTDITTGVTTGIVDMDNARAVEVAGLIFNLGQGVLASSREAEAAASFLTGMDVAKSVGVSSGVARRVTGNVFKRIMRNNAVRYAANKQFGAASALASAALNNDFANRFWVGGLGMWEEGDRYKGNAGYDYDAYGIQLGYDRVFGPVTVGASFGYASGDYDDLAALSNNSEIDNYAVNLYATYNHCSGFFASVIGGYTYTDFDMEQTFAVGMRDKYDYDADTWNIGTTLGYDWRVTENFIVTPSVGLHYYATNTSRFNSTYRNGLEADQSFAELPLALNAQYNVQLSCGVLSLEANAGYSARFSDDGGAASRFSYNGITAGINGANLEGSRNYWNLGAGVTYSSARWDAGLKYDYYTSKSSNAHMLSAQVGFKF